MACSATLNSATPSPVARPMAHATMSLLVSSSSASSPSASSLADAAREITAVRPGDATVLAPGARTRAGTTRGDPPGPWFSDDDARGFGILVVTAEMTRVARGR